MDTAAQTLLIVVSATLTVFLVVLIVATVYLIKVFKRAAEMADSVESAATAVKRGAAAMPVIRLITKLVNKRRN